MMQRYSVLKFLVLLLHVTSTVQVDIIFDRTFFDAAEFIGNIHRIYFDGLCCPNITPGSCCIAPRNPPFSSSVTFRQLTAFDIGAVWRSDSNPPAPGCSGSVMASRRGPGQWQWIMERDTPSGVIQRHAAGASYISLPKALPPDRTTVDWLIMEGMLGLVWGGGKWFASAVAESALAKPNMMPKRDIMQQRDIRSPIKGNLYARPPPRAVFPIVNINGTNYTHSGVSTGDIMFADSEGSLVNLTYLFSGE